jgi:Rrf2 family protein
MLSKKAKYGLKAVLELAQSTDHRPVLVAELAERQGLPKKFLEAILLELKHHGLLQSRKGRGGGYLLGRQPRSITVGQVIRVLDGPLALVPCVSQMSYMKCDECVDEETCGVRIAMKQVRDATAGILDHMSLAALNARASRQREGRRRRGAAGRR